MPRLHFTERTSPRIPTWRVGDRVIPEQHPEGIDEWTVTAVDGVYVTLAGDGITIRRHARQVTAAPTRKAP